MFRSLPSSFYAKTEKFKDMLQEKIDALGDEAREFANEVILEARKIRAAVFAGNKPPLDELKAKVLSAVEKYHGLSNAAKADLEKQFPITIPIFKSEQFVELVGN